MADGNGSVQLRTDLVPRWLRHLWVSHPLVVVSGGVVLAIAVSGVLLWPLTDVVAAHDVGLIANSQRAAALREAREAVRTQLLTLGAGVLGTPQHLSQSVRPQVSQFLPIQKSESPACNTVPDKDGHPEKVRGAKA